MKLTCAHLLNNSVTDTTNASAVGRNLKGCRKKLVTPDRECAANGQERYCFRR